MTNTNYLLSEASRAEKLIQNNKQEIIEIYKENKAKIKYKLGSYSGNKILANILAKFSDKYIFNSNALIDGLACLKTL